MITLLLLLQTRGGAVAWRDDLDAALRDARLQYRPSIVYFTADW